MPDRYAIHHLLQLQNLPFLLLQLTTHSASLAWRMMNLGPAPTPYLLWESLGYYVPTISKIIATKKRLVRGWCWNKHIIYLLCYNNSVHSNLSKNFTFKHTFEFSYKTAFVTHQNVPSVMSSKNLLPRLIHTHHTYVTGNGTIG